MNRRSDIGWFELIVGIILIIFGVVIMRQPVGVLTWIVILCGVLAILSGIGDIVLYVKMEHFTGFGPIVSLVTGILSVMGRIYARGASGSRKLGACNDSSNLDYCALYFQTFSSAVYEDALRNDLLYDFTDSEYPWSARWNPSDLPADDHDPFHGCACRRLHDH